MKSTESFKTIISEHLKKAAEKDPLFAETLKNPKKNIEDCTTYILNQVKASGCSGFADEEIFRMAVHYYDEADIKIGDKITNADVVVNHSVELTKEGLKHAKQKAIDQAVSEAKEKLLSKKKPKKEVPISSEELKLF